MSKVSKAVTSLSGTPIPGCSTSTVLANAATFTGTTFDCSDYGSVVCTVKTDQNGTLYMEFSTDATNWDVSYSAAVVAGTALTSSRSIVAQYYRTRFTNSGGSTQTYLRLQTVAGLHPAIASADGDTPVEVSNFPTEFDVGNFPTSTEVSNFPSSFEVSNFPTEFDVGNFPSSSVVSAANSSTTPLNNGISFTGAWVDVLGYPDLSVAVKTDQNGYFTVQYSPDANNIDSTLTRYYRTNQIEPPHIFENSRQYARVVFTNDSGSNQTYFRLQTILGQRGQLNAPCDSVLAQDYDANVVRPTNFNYEVALGRRQGYTTWNKFGYNADVDVGTEVIASFGGTFTPLTTATTLSIVSSSTSDDGDPAGVGARSIIIYGIDANRDEQNEVVVLDGTTPVVTVSTWLGINRAAVYLAGSSLSNVGTVTITAVTGGTVQGQIPAGEGSTQQCIFFTYDDHTFIADFLSLNAEKTGGGASPKVRIKGWVYSALSNCKYLVFNKLIDTSAENSLQINPAQPFVIGENSCLWFEATTDIADTFASLRFSGIHVRSVSA